MDRHHRNQLLLVGVLVGLTILGLVVLWPDAGRLPEVDPPEDLVGGRLVSVELFEEEADPSFGMSGEMVRLDVELTDGADRGETVTIEAPVEGYPEFEVGDAVQLATSEIQGEVMYFVVDFDRTGALVALGLLFVIAVVAISRWKGVRSLIGLGLSLLVVTEFIIPGIVTGGNPEFVALVGAMAVMLLTLYLAHGVNEMTTAAVLGTTAALTLTIALATLFIDLGKLTGFASEEANLARFAIEGLDLKGLVLAGLIIAALGVLDDVTVTQASTVFALHDANPNQGWGELFRRAMTVGRDHIASTVNTLFLAYAGASLALLVLFATGGLSTGEIVNTEVLAEEIVKTVVGSLGLISAVPFTTALAATTALRRPRTAIGAAAGHVHAGPVVPHPVLDDRPDEDLDDEERAYRSWVRFLRDGPASGLPERPPDDES
ncbi:MAG: YibE/F family protein [Actinobacteria bacterium]|nr:YibE/F family protein [Actinomycetota bacterium]